MKVYYCCLNRIVEKDQVLARSCHSSSAPYVPGSREKSFSTRPDCQLAIDDEMKFEMPFSSGDQQNLIIFLVCYKTYIREPITRKNNSLFSIAIQVQGHKRNHDACALYSLLNSSRGWSDTSRHSSTLEVHSVFTSPPNLVSQRRRSKSGFRIEELDGESKCSVVQQRRLAKNRK